jgi:hypothetical protein
MCTIDTVLAEIEGVLARGRDAPEKTLKRQAGLRYNAVTGGYTEEEILTEAAVQRVLGEFERLPEGTQRLHVLSREGTDPIRFVLADQWEGVNPDAALDALGTIYELGRIPFLAGYAGAARHRIEGRQDRVPE